MYDTVLASLPGVQRLRAYRRSDLRADASAALILTSLLIPAGMGYAEVAGLPPETGLYATIVSLVAYALAGPSRLLILGPDSSLVPVIAAAVAPLALGDTSRAVALAGLLAMLTGVLTVLGGVARLGFVMNLLSKPIRVGYLNGVALTILVNQLPKLFGFSVASDGLPRSLWRFLDGLAHGAAVVPAAVIGIGSLGAILVLRRVTPRVPGLLIAVGAGTLVVWAADLESVPVVGSLPAGLPAPALGGLRWDDVTALLGPALGIALVAFADTGVLSRALAIRDGTRPRDNAEMAALGFTNLACGALGGFPVSGSASRTPVAIASGARTQMTGVIAAALVAGLVVAGPGATTHLPSAALAAVVVTAAFSLADIGGALRLLRVRPGEFALAAAASAGVVGLGVLRGIGLAVALSLVAFVLNAWRPHTAELGRVERRKGYHDLARHPDGHRIPGLVLARFDAPLFFANASTFSAFLRGLVEDAGAPVRWVVLAAEPITDIDTSAADELVALDAELAQRGVRLVFAEMKGPVKDRMARYGLDARFGPDRFYPTLGTAVSDYLAVTGTPWVDWTDRPAPR